MGLSTEQTEPAEEPGKFFPTPEPEPDLEEPVLEETVLEEPVLEEPVLEEPVLEEPVLEEPVLEEPVLEEPVPEFTPLPSCRFNKSLNSFVILSPACALSFKSTQSPFTVYGKTFHSVEQFVLTVKALFYERNMRIKSLSKEIMSMSKMTLDNNRGVSTPRIKSQFKQLLAQNNKKMDDQWEKRRENIIMFAYSVRFNKNYALIDNLIRTGDTIIHYDQKNEFAGTGTILMEIRRVLQSGFKFDL